MHAKWSPVATAVFRYEADVRLNQRSPQLPLLPNIKPLILIFSKLDRLSAETRREWSQSCPTRVFSFNEVTQVPNYSLTQLPFSVLNDTVAARGSDQSRGVHVLQ
jgi:hypothetical protein